MAAASENTLEARVATLERRLADAIGSVETGLCGLDARLQRVEPHPAHALRAREAGTEPHSPHAPDAREGTATLAMRAREVQAREAKQARERTIPAAARASSSLLSGMSLGDVMGGRVLAWLGGVATLLGIVLFLALAISHGWIDERARVLLAGAVSAALLLGGAWLRGHRGRTEAATVMVGTATAGLFATLIVASEVYGLLPGALALVGALLVGTLATVLAIRWAGRAIGGLGLMGALLSGVLVGAPTDPITIAILALTAACAMWVVVWQRWGWLALGTVAICAPQWGLWVLQGQGAPVEALVLAAFAALGLGGAVAAQLRYGEERLLRSSAAGIALSACMVAFVGRIALADAAGAVVGDLWLAGLACAHVGTAHWRARGTRVSPALRRVLIAIGVTLADVVFGLSADGITLALGWSATAVAFAWWARRSAPTHEDATLLDAGIGAHIALVLIRVLVEAPPSELAGGHAPLAAMLAVSALAGGCIACGRLSAGERALWRAALDGLGLLAIAYLTVSTLGGAALAAAWAFEGLALTQLSSRTRDAGARIGALAFIAAAALHALIAEASPVALVTGVTDLGADAVALGALATVGLRAGLLAPAGSARRHWWLLGAGGAVLYLASVATVAALQPTSSTVNDAVLALGVHQQAQVALSALWGIVGLAALIAGLRTNVAPVRTAGLVLLLAAIGKVFLFDLSTLTSVYRVVSFIVLGLLALAGAFAYQRLRPPPPPDLRTVHRSQR